jgi:hypothetical protein
MAKQKNTSAAQNVSKNIKEDNERGARRNLIEELFFDFNRSKSQVYWLNFTRGIFFGIGSVLGGALLIAVSAVVLGQFVDLPGGIGDFIQSVLDAMGSNS